MEIIHPRGSIHDHITWYYVVVEDTQWAAGKYVETSSKKFRGLTLGNTPRTTVRVWVCAVVVNSKLEIVSPVTNEFLPGNGHFKHSKGLYYHARLVAIYDY